MQESKHIEFKEATPLPPKYVDTELQQQTSNQIAATEEWLNDKVKPTLEAEGLTFNIDTINLLAKDTKSIKEMMRQAAIDYLKQIKGFLPDAEKARIHAVYHGIAENLSQLNVEICRNLNKYKFELKQSGKRIIFNPDEVKNYIEGTGVVTHAQDHIDYIAKLNEAAKLLVDIHNYEIEKGYPTYALGQSVLMQTPAGHPLAVQVGLSEDVKGNIDIGKKFEQATFKRMQG